MSTLAQGLHKLNLFFAVSQPPPPDCFPFDESLLGRPLDPSRTNDPPSDIQLFSGIPLRCTLLVWVSLQVIAGRSLLMGVRTFFAKSSLPRRKFLLDRLISQNYFIARRLWFSGYHGDFNDCFFFPSGVFGPRDLVDHFQRGTDPPPCIHFRLRPCLASRPQGETTQFLVVNLTPYPSDVASSKFFVFEEDCCPHPLFSLSSAYLPRAGRPSTTFR